MDGKYKTEKNKTQKKQFTILLFLVIVTGFQAFSKLNLDSECLQREDGEKTTVSYFNRVLVAWVRWTYLVNRNISIEKLNKYS